MTHPLVYIVILNYNGKKWIEACLESVMQTGYDNFRVLLVDNASTDESVEMALRRFPQVETMINSSNLGFSEGNNAGIRKALAERADYVALLNPDTKVTPDWLSHLVYTGEANTRIGIIGSVQLNYDDDDFNSWTISALTQHLDELKSAEKARQWIPVDWVEGSCMAIKKKVFEDIGMLDPIYFAFYEEIDFCRRALCYGYDIALSTRSRVHHYRGGSWQATPGIKEERDYRCDRSQFIFNLTDPRKTMLGNLRLYLVTLATKSKDLLADFSYGRARNLIRTQLDLLGNLRIILEKWRRERAQFRLAVVWSEKREREIR